MGSGTSERESSASPAHPHTPGPWGYWHDSCRTCEERGEMEFVIDGPPGGAHGQFSHEPDARLIAAAPELLVALKALVEFADRMTGRVEPEYGQLTAARAAIAKALSQ